MTPLFRRHPAAVSRDRVEAGFRLACVVTCLLLAALKLYRYYGDRYCLDVFFYATALENFVEGGALESFHFGYLFSAHSYVFLLLFVPLFAVAPTALWLVLSTVPAHGAAAYLVFHLTRKAGGSAVTSVLLGSCYLLGPEVLDGVLLSDFGFQPDALAPPMAFQVVRYWAEGNVRRTRLWAALLASVKEEFALFSAGLGLALFVWDRRPGTGASSVDRRPASRWALVTGCAGAALSFALLVHGKSVTDHAPVPPLPPGFPLPVFAPSALAEAFTRTVRDLPGVAGFLPFLAPELALTIVPVRTAVNLVVYGDWTGFWPWADVAGNIVTFLAAVVGSVRLRRLLPRLPDAVGLSAAVPVVVFSLASGAFSQAFGFYHFWGPHPRAGGAVSGRELSAEAEGLTRTTWWRTRGRRPRIVIPAYLNRYFPDADPADHGLVHVGFRPGLYDEADGLVAVSPLPPRKRAEGARPGYRLVARSGRLSLYENTKMSRPGPGR